MFINKKIYAWRDSLTLLVAIVVSIFLIFSNQGIKIGGLQIATLYSISQLQKPFLQLKKIASSLDENKKLLVQNARLQIENSRLREAYLENLRLRKLVGFMDKEEIDCLPVKVIGRGAMGSIASIVLDAGEKDGLKRNMPIIEASGIVGKVYAVGENASLGQIVLDRNFRVSARIQRSRVEGVVQFEGGDRCRFSDVPMRSDIQVGDVVISSGFSAIFPSGMRIGVVTHVDEQSYGLLKSVYLKPSVDFNRLEEVLVIRNYPREREYITE